MLQQVSARSVARDLSLPWSTVHKVLSRILRRYPYEIKIFQELKPHNDTLRIDFANFVLSKIREDDAWVQIIKKSSTTLHQVKTGKHEGRNITATYDEKEETRASQFLDKLIQGTPKESLKL